MPRLPEADIETDEASSKDEANAKRHKPASTTQGETPPLPGASCAPRKRVTTPRAAIPNWLKYDSEQTKCFGTPIKHEILFKNMFAPTNYIDEWISEFIKDMRTLTQGSWVRENIIVTLSLDWVSAKPKATSEIPGGASTSTSEPKHCVLTLSRLIFDNIFVQYHIHELIFWSLAWECFCKRIKTFVISNPLPLVRKAFLHIARLNHFDFDISATNDLTLDFEIMQRMVSHIPYYVLKTNCVQLKKAHEDDTPEVESINIRPSPYEGTIVSKNYLENFEYFLSRIFATPVGFGYERHTTEVFRIFAEFYEDVLYLNRLEARPCFQGFRSGRIVLNVLINYCIENNINTFYVECAFSPTKHLCDSLGFKLVKDTRNDYKITLEEMKKIAQPEQCGLPDDLLWRDETHPGLFRLDHTRFPTSDYLNDQDAVDAGWKDKGARS